MVVSYAFVSLAPPPTIYKLSRIAVSPRSLTFNPFPGFYISRGRSLIFMHLILMHPRKERSKNQRQIRLRIKARTKGRKNKRGNHQTNGSRPRVLEAPATSCNRRQFRQNKDVKLRSTTPGCRHDATPSFVSIRHCSAPPPSHPASSGISSQLGGLNRRRKWSLG